MLVPKTAFIYAQTRSSPRVHFCDAIYVPERRTLNGKSISIAAKRGAVAQFGVLSLPLHAAKATQSALPCVFEISAGLRVGG